MPNLSPRLSCQEKTSIRRGDIPTAMSQPPSGQFRRLVLSVILSLGDSQLQLGLSLRLLRKAKDGHKKNINGSDGHNL